MPNSNEKKQFQKSALTSEAHVELMASRGLSIPDIDRAKHYLRFISYYRLSGYALSFQIDANKDGTHSFEPGTNFEQILQLYIFDRKLRLLITDALERLEVAFRTCMSDELAVLHGPHWYMEASHFSPKSFSHADLIGDIKRAIHYDKESKRSNIPFIAHYFRNYESPQLPPSWMVFEMLSFGAVSVLFSNLTIENKKVVSKPFEFHHTVLASWLHSLSYLRNLCAHHQRLWNRVFTIKPMVARGYEDYLANNNRLYAQLVVVQILLKKIAHDTRWHRKLNELLNGYNTFVPASKMGFPEDWRRQGLWGIGKSNKAMKILPV